MDTETPAGRAEEKLLGGPRRYNRVQVSEATGVDRDRAHRLWMAMGFAEVGDDEAVFTDGDIEALRTWNALVESGTIAIEEEVPHARVMGQTLSRLAEWQAREVIARTDVLAPGGEDRLASVPRARQTQESQEQNHAPLPREGSSQHGGLSFSPLPLRERGWG